MQFAYTQSLAKSGIKLSEPKTFAEVSKKFINRSVWFGLDKKIFGNLEIGAGNELTPESGFQ
jgi:hypothetical protein